MKNYQVKVLKPGYAESTGPTQQRADGTITLIKGPHNIVVDTGGPWNKRLIPRKLREEGLSAADIDYVICTHGHSDHVGNINLFPNATVILSYDICNGDNYTFHSFAKSSYKINDDVEIIATPGHTEADISVIVRTRRGTYVIAGDLFECAEDLTNDRLWREFSEHPEEHERNRRKVLELADFIVPGHGDMFEVPKAVRAHGEVEEKPSNGLRSKIVWGVVVAFGVSVTAGLAVWAVTEYA